MGWTLDQLLDLSDEDHDELIAWVKDKADRAERRGEEGTDVDAVIAAKAAKEARGRD